MKVLVVGCGSIGRRHLGNLRALGIADIIACDLDSDRASKVSEQYGIPVSLSLVEALQQGPDAALICTHPANHLKAAQAAAEAGCHLFIEKPISHSLEGLHGFIREVEARSLVTCVGYNWRFHPSFQRLKQLIDEGSIGTVLCARVNCGQYLPDWHPWEDYRQGYSAKRLLGGGVLLDSHEFDYVTWFLGEVERVSCIARTISRLEIDTEDTADVVLEFQSGAQASLHLDYLQRPAQRSYELFGTEGTIRWSLGESVTVLSPTAGKAQIFSDPPGFDLNTTYLDELRHFLCCVQNRSKASTDALRGKYILELVMAAKESAQTQKVVGIEAEVGTR